MELEPKPPPGPKSEFRTDLDTRLVCEFEDTHRLLADFVYYSELLGEEITVPKDFVTDYASVPRVVGAYLLVGGKGKRAAVIHDWLYTSGKYSREMCDRVFKEALTAAGYGAITIGLMYMGVRVGGGSHFTAPNIKQEPHVEAAIAAAQPEAP
jgi:hypothetical protein